MGKLWGRNQHFWGIYAKGIVACDPDCEERRDDADGDNDGNASDILDVIF